MNYQLIAAIAALCQITGSYGSKSIAMSGGSYRDDKVVEIEFSYSDAAKQQLKCQKYYINCIQKDYKMLDQCILDRK